MTSRLLDLDIVNPRGWGYWGLPEDPVEHGHQVTDNDIENLKKHYGVKISYHTINDNKYKLISLLHKDATDTIVSILGGDGKYYVIDSNNIPNGLIMPFFEYCIAKKLNLIIIDPDHPLEHAWLSRMSLFPDDPLDFYNSSINATKDLKRKIWFKNFYIQKKWFTKAREFYIQHHARIKKDLFLKNKILFEIHTFITDIEKILEYIKSLTNSQLWLMGHCTGANVISMIHDIRQYNHLYRGIIFLNPWWKLRWREIGLDEMKYFLTTMTKPLLIIQHAEDPCGGTHPEIAKKIINDTNSSSTRYSELNGGIDQGCPYFSVGYHGFRGIEHKVIDEINNFILDHGKI